MAIFGTGGLTLGSGFSISNFGIVTWSSSPTITSNATVTNTSCGGMSFSQNLTLQNGATLNNSGVLTIQSALTTAAGSIIDNRGRFTVKGRFCTPRLSLKINGRPYFWAPTITSTQGAILLSTCTPSCLRMR